MQRVVGRHREEGPPERAFPSDIRRCSEQDVDRDVAIRGRPVPQLPAGLVEAPALDPARARQRAGVVAAGGDRADAAREPADVDRDVAIRGRPVPQLAEGVVAPALDRARARQRAGVGAAGGDRADAAREPADVDRDVAIDVFVPFPSCPSELRPQHLTPPALVSAQVWSPPAAIALTPLASPLTSTGTLLSVFVPFPSWPEALLPQHLTAPALVSAQVWSPPAAIALTPLASPLTSTGTLLSVVVPFPSWPKTLSPQHLTAPALVSAQVWTLPAAIALTPLASPLTSTGTLLSVFVPFPSWPKPLKPQHLTPPALVSAQVWTPPAAIALTPLASPLTSTGTLLSVVVPFPSSPTKL